MSSIQTHIIITFVSTSDAMYAEKLLQQKSVDIKLIALPGKISAGCGFAIRTDIENLEQIKSIITGKVKESYYIQNKIGDDYQYTKL